MLVPRLIERKRDGAELEPGAWPALIRAYVAGEVPDYQMAALAMAVVFRGLSPRELNELVDAMLTSGDRLDFTGFPLPRVDKHSIGGVGDKTSLLLAPMLACCGAAVPMISGRGLGHTGGTLDKLEAIPGFRTQLSLEEARAQLDRIGVVMLGQTPRLVPADRKLYALRDVTGTVESVPLIAASIMSKKLAEDLTGLVLDIKTGSGSFLPDPAHSLELAQTMLAIGEARGCRTVGLLTAMDRPLGHACGNALETIEAIRGLEGQGPPDLMEVTLALGVEMLLVAGLEADRRAARKRLEDTLASGAALEKLEALISAQGGDPGVVRNPGGFRRAERVEPWPAPASGVVTGVEPRTLGHAIVRLGGGRLTAADAVDHAVGFVIPVKPGDPVRAGDPIAEIHARDEAGVAVGREALARALTIGEAARPTPLISARVEAGGVVPLDGPAGPEG
jgi:pyrimidine-nucleoside phosphorylase